MVYCSMIDQGGLFMTDGAKGGFIANGENPTEVGLSEDNHEDVLWLHNEVRCVGIKSEIVRLNP